MRPNEVKALVFDVFGTVVDWRSSVIREAQAFGARKGIERDWTAFAVDWRKAYRPAMNRVTSGELPWMNIDALHRMALLELLDRYDITGLSDAEIDDLNRAWHRLDPWPDAVPGLTRLKARYILATMSNGNIALMVNMARRACLPWDAVLGAEVAQAYKPERKAYETTARLLGLANEEVMLVAAHNPDLAAARGFGFRTAFVIRPTEHGPDQTINLTAEQDWDVVAADFRDLAAKLGC